MRWILPVLAAGCVGGGSDAEPALFELGIAADEVHDLDGADLEVTVDQIVVEGDGPDGPESVVVVVDALFEPLHRNDSVPILLPVGVHRDVELRVAIGARGGPGIALEWGGKDRIVRIDVEAVELSFPLQQLAIDDKMPAAEVRLHPDRWVDELELEDFGPDEIVIDPSSGDRYDRLVDAIVRTSDFSPEWTRDAGHDDDDDDGTHE